MIYVTLLLFSWDKQYELELENFLDHGDIGEIWFGKRIMDTIVKWVTDTMDKENSNILDLGCGNYIFIQLSCYTQNISFIYDLCFIIIQNRKWYPAHSAGNITDL